MRALEPLTSGNDLAGRDRQRHHRSAACRTRRVERFHAPVAIFVDAPNDATLGDAESAHDLDVDSDRAWTAQHTGEHRHTLLGESVGRRAAPAAACL